MTRTTAKTRTMHPYGNIHTSMEIGLLVRQKRKADKLTQAELAAVCSVGTRLVSELENGKETIELAKVLQILETLGLELYVLPRGMPPSSK